MSNELPTNIIIRERKEALISGVSDVLSFDDLQIEAETTAGRLVLQGTGLKILGLDRSTGELKVEGRVDRVFFPAQKAKRPGLWEALKK